MLISKGLILQSLLFLIISAFIVPYYYFKLSPVSDPFIPDIFGEETSEATDTEIVMMATREIHGVQIEQNPPQSKLDQLGIPTWPKWTGQPSKIPWTFEAKETMYLLEGKVKVSVDGHEETFEIGAGDLVVFPKGMKITFDVLEAVTKHYKLEK